MEDSTVIKESRCYYGSSSEFFLTVFLPYVFSLSCKDALVHIFWVSSILTILEVSCLVSYLESELNIADMANPMP